MRTYYVTVTHHAINACRRAVEKAPGVVRCRAHEAGSYPTTIYYHVC